MLVHPARGRRFSSAIRGQWSTELLSGYRTVPVVCDMQPQSAQDTEEERHLSSRLLQVYEDNEEIHGSPQRHHSKAGHAGVQV